MSGNDGVTFLLEIGCEELPDRIIRPALDHLAREIEDLAERERIGRPVWDPPRLGTPRRLAWRCQGLLSRQEDREVEVAGPRVAAAFDPHGRPTRAVEGFARAQGVPVADLRKVSSPKGDYLAARRRRIGRPTGDVLSASLPALISGIPFAKTMRWGEGSFRFARPIHWIVCLLNGEVVPFEVAGIQTGRISRGARFEGSPELTLPDARQYLDVLERAGVQPDLEARRERIERELAAEAERLGEGLRIEKPAGLLDSVNGMVEHPVAAAGDFDPAFLSLPAPILVTAMVHHQRFFPIRRRDGSLDPHYLAVLNCRREAATIVNIRRGNEWVLRARLRDADFFWREDRKRRLEDRLPDLEKVLFEATLGNYRQKASRMEELVRALAAHAAGRGDPLETGVAVEAARLAKSDLTTLMVQEFPELQGTVGGLLARAEGKREEVSRAVEEQYSGSSEGSGRAGCSSREAAALVVADRLDTLVGFFLLGKVPTGSRDPYGLRRSAAALVQASLDQALRYPLDALMAEAVRLYRSQGFQGGEEEIGKLPPFVEERLRYAGQELHGFRYDAVNAALAVGANDLVDAFRRAEALHRIRGLEDFEALSLSYRRVKNILAGHSPGHLEEGKLGLDEEKALLRSLAAVEAAVEPLLAAGDYTGSLRRMATLQSPLDRFFDKVLVMDPNSRIRENRLALLTRISVLFRRVGDFAEMVLEGETAGTAERGKRA